MTDLGLLFPFLIGWDEGNPTDNSIVSQFPSNERAQRSVQASAWAIEHDDVDGRHIFGVGNTAARDAITTWGGGALWVNSSAGAGNFVLQAVSSATASVITWEDTGRFTSADEVKLDAQTSVTATSAEASAGSETANRLFSPVLIFTAINGRTATSAEVAAGSNTNDFITPAAMKSSLNFSDFFESGELSISADTEVTAAHGFGSVPKLVYAVLICKSAEKGWSVGDEVRLTGLDQPLSAGGVAWADATNIGVAMENTPFRIYNRTSQANEPLTDASWRIVIRAWGTA